MVLRRRLPQNGEGSIGMLFQKIEAIRLGINYYKMVSESPQANTADMLVPELDGTYDIIQRHLMYICHYMYV